MGTLADSGLIARAAGALTDGHDEEITDGQSYQFVGAFYDGSGDALDYTDLTAVCAAWAAIGDTDPVLTFDTAWSTVDGQSRLTVSAGEDATRGLALGRRNRSCVWALWFDDGTDAVYVWSAADSNLTFQRS